jgi:hypothetical protein
MKNYTPRVGSKVAMAYQALIDGPMTVAQLAIAMSLPPNNVHNTLKPALSHEGLVRLRDETGLAYFSLAGMPVDERFSRIAHEYGTSANARGRPLADKPTVRHVTSHESPSAAALAAANPFRKTGPESNERPAKQTPVAPPPTRNFIGFQCRAFFQRRDASHPWQPVHEAFPVQRAATAQIH